MANPAEQVLQVYNTLGALAEELAIFKNHLIKKGFTQKEATELCNTYFSYQLERSIRGSENNETN